MEQTKGKRSNGALIREILAIPEKIHKDCFSGSFLCCIDLSV